MMDRHWIRLHWRHSRAITPEPLLPQVFIIKGKCDLHLDLPLHVNQATDQEKYTEALEKCM